MATVDLFRDLPDRSPDALRAARLAAGLSQAQAAALVGLGQAIRWSEYERGARAIDEARWALFLLAVDAHPCARVSTLQRRRAGAGQGAAAAPLPPAIAACGGPSTPPVAAF